jgi:beta-N-acetylglucosaminidase
MFLLILMMVQSTLANGLTISDTVLEFIFGLKAHDTKANGVMTNVMDEVK